MRSTCPVVGFESSDASHATAGAEFPGFMPSNWVYSSGFLIVMSWRAWPTMRVKPPGPMQLARTP
jgi:hypothetical protein